MEWADGHGILTNDLHVMSLNSYELRPIYLNLFKGVTADKIVVENNCITV
jgi:hypothetical protein